MKKVDKELYVSVVINHILMDLMKIFPDRSYYSLLIEFVKSDTYRLLYKYRAGYWNRNPDEILKIYGEEKGYILPYFENDLIVKYLMKSKNDYERCFIILMILLKCCDLDNKVLSDLICKCNLVGNIKLDLFELLNILDINNEIKLDRVLEKELDYCQKVRKYDVLWMKMIRFREMCLYLEDRFENRNDLVSVIVKSKTFDCLCDTKSNFWWKSKEEICYLIYCELKGDIDAWEWQAF